MSPIAQRPHDQPGRPVRGPSFEPLSPVSFLDRAAHAHGSRIAIVDGNLRFTYTDFRDRSARLAGALSSGGDTRPVAVLAPNSHTMLEAHFGVPWSGRPLVALNTRLSPSEVGYILDHCGASILIADRSLHDLATAAVDPLTRPPRLIIADGPGSEYEALLSGATPYQCWEVEETGLLAINYTSGTTGAPKGVMYQHRGAYLQALSMVAHMRLSPRSVHLWTLPMFHCNGWCFTWAVTAACGTHVCLRQVDLSEIWRLVRQLGVTHLNGAPTLLSMIADARDAASLDRAVTVGTGGSPPAPALLRRLSALGFEVTHLYGLTETYGPAMLCEWPPEWDRLDAIEQSRRRARQGVGNLVSCVARVVDADGVDLPHDGTTLGEIALRGNNVTTGYWADAEATARATPDGWFRTGDLGVIHPDGYVQLYDRSKDVIISGGENISSVEIEQVIADHPAVSEVAVIALPDDRWGEVPAAYVTLRQADEVSAEELAQFVRERLARYKVPKQFRFGELPKTSTGKIRKAELREAAWGGREQRIQ